MDTFFATKKFRRSSLGHICCKIFVTAKGFIYGMPINSKGKVLQAIKQVDKEIYAPEAIICDVVGEQTSINVCKLCRGIGTTMRVLEKETLWLNKYDLYICLINEPVRKDTE